jgi:hypothetical protein
MTCDRRARFNSHHGTPPVLSAIAMADGADGVCSC